MGKDKSEIPKNPLENVQSHDWNKERLDKLKELMPDLFTNEGKLNIYELNKVIDPDSVGFAEKVSLER